MTNEPPPRLVACWFRAKKEPDGAYDRLARVLAYTARQHCPGWHVQIDQLTHAPRRVASGNPSHDWNSQKLDYWQQAVEQAPDGTRLLLMDADMVILQPLGELWDQPFDLAYTIRHGGPGRLPLNGGVVALRVSDPVRAVMRRWVAENQGMVEDGSYHLVWRRKYAGINQASFGCVLESGGFDGLQVATLPCAEWNCVEWGAFDASRVRILHVKSMLRRAVFQGADRGHLKPLVKLWHALEREALTLEAQSA